MELDKQKMKEEWVKVEAFISQRFEEKLDVTSILYMIGLQELGHDYSKFQKDQKVDIIHIGVCSVLLPFGYYSLIEKDEDGWPVFQNLKSLPITEGVSQEDILKNAIIHYLKL